eukprot:12889977-Ditylum_brightwellii.AAC.1
MRKKQKEETPVTIQDSIGKIAQTWEQVLFGLGGKLSPKKTYWWLIWRIWNGDKAKIATKKEAPIDSRITFGQDSVLTTIKRKNLS